MLIPKSSQTDSRPDQHIRVKVFRKAQVKQRIFCDFSWSHSIYFFYHQKGILFFFLIKVQMKEDAALSVKLSLHIKWSDQPSTLHIMQRVKIIFSSYCTKNRFIHKINKSTIWSFAVFFKNIIFKCTIQSVLSASQATSCLSSSHLTTSDGMFELVRLGLNVSLCLLPVTSSSLSSDDLTQIDHIHLPAFHLFILLNSYMVSSSCTDRTHGLSVKTLIPYTTDLMM